MQEDPKTQFVFKIASEVNQFFSTISPKNKYSFDCSCNAEEISQEKTMRMKKAYRNFKKFLISNKLIDLSLGEKARERVCQKIWEYFNEGQKIVYLDNNAIDTKNLPRIREIVSIVMSQRKTSNSSLKKVISKNSESKAKGSEDPVPSIKPEDKQANELSIEK